MIILLILSLMIVNVDDVINKNHNTLFESVESPLWVRGGTGSGKTYSICDKLHIQTQLQNDVKLKSLVIRKTLPSLRLSTLEIMAERAEVLGVPWDLNKSEWIARSRNHKFIFLSLHDSKAYERLKSMTNIDFAFCNEINELTEYDQKIIRTRLRGGQSWFKQFIGDFNPTDEYHWLYKKINIEKEGQELVYNIDSNPWADRDLIEFLKGMKETDPNFYDIMFLGKWGKLEGLIYNWDVVPLPDIKFDEIIYGGDFGYSVNPAAFAKIYRKADEFWVQGLVYELGLTNPLLANRINDTEYTKGELSYWDNSEPKSIQELCDCGITAMPAEKGPDSVRFGLDYLKSSEIHIVKGSTNIIKEARGYIWKKDKDGNSLNEPVKFNDHHMDAIRYAIHTHCKRKIIKPWIGRARRDEAIQAN